MATGFVLNIPNEMLRRLDEADRKIEQLGVTGERVAGSVVQSFLHMKNAGVDEFISSLNNANKALNQLGSVKVQGGSLQNIAEQATNSADEVHLLIASIYELIELVGSGKGRQLKLIDSNDDSFARIADVKKEIAEINAELDRGGTQETGAITQERQEHLRNLREVLKEELKWLEAGDTERANIIEKRIRQAKRVTDTEISEARRSFNEQVKIYRQNTTYEGALAFSQSAKTENQHAQAIEYLIGARKRLIAADADYANKLNTLNVAIQEHQRFLKDVTLTDEQRATAAKAAAKARQDELYSDPVMALNYASNAKTISEYEQAIKYLTAAQKQLNTTDAYYSEQVDQINTKLREAQKIVKESTMTATERAEAERRVADALKKKQEAELAADRSSSPDKALAFSSSATNINQQIEAIKYLKIARDNLSKTDSNYEQTVSRLNQEIRRQQTEVDRLRGKSEALGKSHRNLMDISGQLARKLALVFSVSQMMGYFNKLVQVRGELELQQRSLQAILKSKQEADDLWNKTVQLAVRSPYQIKDLVTYTKQLAAYRVESEKLHDTTKMLADVSSGLGVDMQRLILAYGQVKAANYLRGTELRQFSEAGINILGELATYFSELEGTSVSVAEVFERVSKRMVTFADVEEIFKRITSAGGTFYQMQEIQAETLKGQISNLKDAITVMLNDIGEANEGALKGGVGAVRTLVENWEIIPPLIAAVIASLSVAKVAALTTNKSIIEMAKVMNVVASESQKQLSIQQLLQTGFRKIGSSLANMGSSLASFVALNGPLLAVVAAIAAAGFAIKDFVNYSKELKAIARDFEQMRKPVQELSIAFTKAEWNKELKQAQSELNKLISLAEREYGLHFDLSIEDINKMDLKQVEDAFEQVRSRVLNANRIAEDFATAMAKAQQKQQWFGGEAMAIGDMSFGEGLWGATFGGISAGLTNTMLKDIDQFGTTAKKTFDLIRQNASDAADAVIQLNDELTEEQRMLIENLTRSQDREESEAQYFKRIKDAYEGLIPLFEKIGYQNDKIDRQLRKIARREREVMREFENFEFDVNEHWTTEERTIALRVAIDKFAFDKEYNEFQKDLLNRLANNKFGVQIGITADTEKDSPLDPQWVTNVTAKLKEVNQKITQEAKKAGIKDTDITTFPLPTQGETQKDYLARFKEVQAQAKQTYTETQQMYNKTTTDMTKILSDHVAEAEGYVNISSKVDTASKKSNDIWSERLNLIKNIANEYENLSQHLSAQAVDDAIIRKYADTWKESFGSLGMDIKDFSWDTSDGVMAAFDALLDKTTDASDQIKVKLEKEDFRISLQVALAEESLDNSKAEIDKLFDQYKAGVDLKKMGITAEMAKALFGFETLSFDELSEAVAEFEDELTGKEGVDAYKAYLAKLSEIEAKEQEERIKKYLEYTRDAIGERAKIKFEEMSKLQEIEDSFIAKPDATEAEIRLIEEKKAKAKAGVRKEAAAQLQEYDWKEFQKTETFIHIMEDLENASDSALSSMIQQLESFRDQWTNMPVDQMKQIVDLIQKMEDARLDNKNPFGGARALRRQVAADGRDIETAEMDMLQAEQTLQAYKEQESVLEAINQKRAEGATNEQLIAYFGAEYQGIINAGQPALDVQLDRIRKNREQQDKIVKSAKSQIDAINRLNKLYKKQGDFYRDLLGMAQDLYDAFESLYEALGGDEDALGKVFADAGMQIMTSVLNTLALQAELKSATVQAGTLAAAMNAAAGVVGWIVMAVQILASVLSAVFKAHDKGLENQIEHITERVENLQKHYEKLEEAIDQAYSTEQLAAYTNQLESTAKAQIAAIRSMIALEEAKKSTDKDRIEEWEEQIEDLEANLADALRDAVSTATDGILDDTLGTARDFVDAWYEAFSEVGDGLSGLQDNFQEMLANLVQQQATMQIAGKFLDRWKTYLGEYINEDDLELTTEEAQAFAARVKAELPELSAALEAFFSTMYDTIDGAAGGVELSGLQKGISSITEETAQILEAYLNSVRFYVADSNSKLAQLVATWANPEIENPMLTNLKIIAKQTSDIHTLLDSLTAPHPTEAGRGLKVII